MLTLVCLGAPAMARAQISPGPLARPHEQLEGALHCVTCHGGGSRKEQMTALCLHCHKEIAWLGQRERGLHGRVREQSCASCHPDHAGRDFAMIGWPGGDSSRFDHARTGWRLDGSHQKTPCADCHKAALRVSRAARLSERRAPNWGWVGLERACVTCHEDVHRGRLGAACANCHGTTDFKTISPGKFNHDRTHYPLRGRHRTVACEKCHDFSGGKVSSSRSFVNCTDCHADAHAGTATLAARVVDCASCHVVDDWRPATYTVAQHRLARYPLEGRHQQVKCADCHLKDPPGVPATSLGSARVWLRPAAAQCRDCHADDHGGQLATRADGGACSACHRVDAWTPSTFTVAQHAATRLRLEARHAEIACSACHGRDRKGLPPLPGNQVLGKAGVALKLKEVACAACHVDPHKGRFAVGGSRAQGKGCLACHNALTFRPSTTDVAAHATFSFVLEGAHRATACVGCHAEFKQAGATRRSSLLLAASGIAELRFEAKHECAACHQTPHGTQFDARKDRGRCDACHGVDAFAPASKFDHTRDATFSTRGAHEHVPCNQCHPTDQRRRTPKAVIYRPVSGKCESCHGKESR